MLKKLKLLNLARKAARDGGKLVQIIKEDQAATSTSLIPQRKVRYAALAAGIVAFARGAAAYYGYDIPPVVDEYATEGIVGLIFTVLYMVKPKRGEVVND